MTSPNQPPARSNGIDIFIPDTRRRFGGDYESVLVHTNFNTVHVINDGPIARIYIRDHANISIVGGFHDKPTIIVDSDEYPTHLRIARTEHPWESVLRDPNVYTDQAEKCIGCLAKENGMFANTEFADLHCTCRR